MPPELGTTLAGYRIDAVVGRGGMGVVYRATELGLDRPVALKLIAPELAHDEGFRGGFLRESRLAASLDHPGILPVYAAGEVDGELYLATRFVDGTDLRTLLVHAGPLPPERALAVVGQVADALDAAHARGLVHRDVKPGNVLLDASDHCYLCDFGLTKQLGHGATTVSGRLAGSLDFLAPEQIRGDAVAGRTDQYALACVLYECLAGAPPFRRETEAQTLWAHMQEAPAPVASYPELDAVFARALAKDLEERYESCNAFVEDARVALGLGTSLAVRRRRRRVGRRLVLTGSLLFAASVGAAVLALTLGTSEPLRAPPNSVAVADPVSSKTVAAVSVGNAPTEITASDRYVWVLNSNDGAGTISRIDARSRRLVSTFSIGGTPRNILAAFGALWVGTVEGRVFRVDPRTDLVEASWNLPNAGVSDAFDLDQGAGWLTAGAGAVWAGSLRAISRIDPTTSQLRSRRSPTWGPMAYGFGSLWVLGDELERLSPTTMRRIATVALASGFVRVATGFGSVWVSDDESGAVLRVDPRQEAVSRTYDVGGKPYGLAVGADAVWVASDTGGIARIDPMTGEVSAITVGGAPRSVALAAGVVWASVN